MCLGFTPNPSCIAVYLSRTIFILFWYICICVMISIKSFTIENFVEITIKPLIAHRLMALGYTHKLIHSAATHVHILYTFTHTQVSRGASLCRICINLNLSRSLLSIPSPPFPLPLQVRLTKTEPDEA